MGRVSSLAVLLVLLVPGLAAQVPEPNLLGDILAPVTDPLVATVVSEVENLTGEDIASEDIDLAAHIAVDNVDYQIVGILFGGGKVQADATADLHLEFRALSVERLDQALRAMTGDANISLYGTFGVPTHRLALTAEEVRTVGAGVVLQALQSYQESLTKTLVEDMVPGMTVLSSEFRWSNTFPARWVYNDLLDPSQLDPTDPQIPDVVPPLREPPLVLDATVRLQFLDRFSLVGILETALSGDDGNATDEDPQKELRRRIEENQTAAFLDRSAFQVLGFGQLLAFSLPPGWDLDVTLDVPEGFTIEGATDELLVGSTREEMQYVLNGEFRAEPASQAGVVTLSSRYLVTTTLLGLVALVGMVLRVTIEGGVMSVAYRRFKGGQRPPFWRRIPFVGRLLQSRAKA